MVRELLGSGQKLIGAKPCRLLAISVDQSGMSEGGEKLGELKNERDCHNSRYWGMALKTMAAAEFEGREF